MIHRYFDSVRGGVALYPASVANSGSVTGPTISKPHLKGRTLELRVHGGNLHAALDGSTGVDADGTKLAIKVQGYYNGAWETLKDNDGNDLRYTITTSGTPLRHNLENSSLKGVLYLDRLKYESYRLTVNNTTGQAVLLSASYTIGDLYHLDEAIQRDHFVWKTTPYTEAAPQATSDD